MNSTLSLKCVPYINGPKHNVVRGVYFLTQRFKSDDSPSDNNKFMKNQQAIDKLNDLLKTMKKGNNSEITSKMSKHIELAHPRQLARKAEEDKQKNDELNKNKPLGEKLSDAASIVAKSIGGDPKKTESELLNLLRIYNKEHNDTSEKVSKSSARLGDLISGMKIDRSQSNVSSKEYQDIDKAQRVRQLIGKGFNADKRVKTYKKPMDNYIPINIFGSSPLDIFKKFKTKTNCVTLPTWDKLYEKSLSMAITHPPKNIYEQMIIWTEQGKLWKFPIDNELGMENESNVFFAEHVFLEPLIDEWCPKKGPIRHFMELVCVGLSKNPFLSVEEKKDHINWFRQYFYEKNKLLNEVGAFEIKSLPENIKEYYKPTIPEL